MSNIAIRQSQVDQLLALIRQVYPDWQNFNHPRFVADEIGYKRKAVELMHTELSHSEFERLLSQNALDEIVQRLEKVARATNLLYQSTPQTGDLRILYADAINRGDLCRQLFHLLHDSTGIDVRLQRYLDFVSGRSSALNYWTFPTYFLFLLYPDQEMFVKPTLSQRYLTWFGLGDAWTGKPSVAAYTTLVQLVQQIKDALRPYEPHDLIDIQSLLWVAFRLAAQPRVTAAEQAEAVDLFHGMQAEDPQKSSSESVTLVESELAAPFSDIFSCKADALWAFDILAAALKKVGIASADDERFVVTLPAGEQALHCSIGNWLVLGFQRDLVRIPFLEGTPIDEQYRDYTFSQPQSEPQVIGYRLPYAMLRPMPAEWQAGYDGALAHIAQRVSTHVRSTWRKNHHVPAIAAALFDPVLREQLLRDGLPSSPEPPIVEPKVEPPVVDLPDPVPGCPFSRTTFTLLAQLHAEPTIDFYLAHKDNFIRHVEEPFKRVLLEAGRWLPAPIREVMETEKRIFARFPKNDWGQGGAWDHYWGAFYPKGSKRSQDAQLSMWMNYRYMEFGFYIGDYGSEQRLRFQRNCERNAGPLSKLMNDLFAEGEIVLAGREEFTLAADGRIVALPQRNWADFIRNPSAANCDASIIIPAPQLLTLTFEELVQRVVHAHQRLFPLVLTALLDEPMAAISEYLEPILEGAPEEEERPPVVEPEPPAPYTEEMFLQETFLRPEDLTDLIELLQEKKQLILQGPPGTGKTYVAQRLAKLLIGLAQPGPRMRTVQFHPAYGYEDFIEGIRPESKVTVAGQQVVEYPVLAGRFREFCERAARFEADTAHVFIIDEINRGNIPRIFGELMYLLEYRQESVVLPYSGKEFQIPANVYLIGTMNTADRSIALVDFALRRRFHFVRMAADPDLFDRWLAANSIDIPYLGKLYRRLCCDAIDDPNYQIGPSYFMQHGLTKAKLERVWRYSIEPFLHEYYAENEKKALEWAWDGELVQGSRAGG